MITLKVIRRNQAPPQEVHFSPDTDVRDLLLFLELTVLAGETRTLRGSNGELIEIRPDTIHLLLLMGAEGPCH